VLRQVLIFGPDNVLAVDSFEPANGEMTSSHLLKMLDKCVIDGRTGHSEAWVVKELYATLATL
jgi:hypothetical protein